MKRTSSPSSLNNKRRIKDLDKLSPKQISKYEDSLEVLQFDEKTKNVSNKSIKDCQYFSKNSQASSWFCDSKKVKQDYCKTKR